MNRPNASFRRGTIKSVAGWSLLMLLTMATSPAIGADAGDPKAIDRFTFIHREDLRRHHLARCISHAYGSLDDGIEHLQASLAGDSHEHWKSVYVCQANQLEALRRTAPLVEVADVNPYVVKGAEGPDDTTRIWPGVDHPMINQLRLLREATHGHRILARLYVERVQWMGFFQNRAPLPEEIEWKFFAAIGAEYDGVAWGIFRDGENDVSVRTTRRLERELAPHLTGLFEATTDTNWRVESADANATVLARGGEAYVVLLHPDYVPSITSKGTVPLPIEQRGVDIEIWAKAPEGMMVEEIRDLSGAVLPFRNQDERGVAINYRLRRGGDMLIVQYLKADDAAHE